MKQMSYEKWLKVYNLEKNICECDCEDCNGIGVIECEYCGQDTECEECEGCGSLQEDKTQKEYDIQFLNDKDKIKKYEELL